MDPKTIVSNGNGEAVREKMRRYWQVYKPSIESMMLSHDARYFAENEQNELLSYLPPFKGLKVLELGAGIGRFTSRFAQMASHVTAIDFMESYIKENEETNGHFENVTFQCADVTLLDFPEDSFDLIFSNWLLMYLSNSEVEKLMKRVHRWLKPEGFFFFRESCYHQSGNVSRTENPTKYRTPLDYIAMLSKVSTPKTKFILKTTKNVLTYVHYHGNPNQLCLLAVKREKEQHEELSHKAVIDLDQGYSHVSAGKDKLKFGSLIDIPAGEFMIKNLSIRLGLRAGQRILNIGCAEGAIATYLVRNYEVHLHGIDVSPVNIHYAIDSQGKLELSHRKKIQYESTDWIDAELSMATYEAVLCFDMLLSKEESMKLISKAQRWLKHNGKLATLIFVKGENSSDRDTNDFVEVKWLEDYLRSLNFTLQEIKSESELALKYLRAISFDLMKINTEEQTKTLEEIKKKIYLLETKRTRLVKIIVAK